MKNQLYTPRQQQEMEFKKKQASQMKFQEELSKEENKVPVSIDFIYQKKLGKVLPITVNGVTITISVNGKTHYVPQCFADEVAKMKRQLNIEEQRASKSFRKEQGDLSPTGPIPGT